MGDVGIVTGVVQAGGVGVDAQLGDAGGNGIAQTGDSSGQHPIRVVPRGLAGPHRLIAHLCQFVRSEDFQVKASALRVARDIANATADPEGGRRLARVIKSC